MIYLDYSATTPVNADVLKTFDEVCLNYMANPNSDYSIGIEARELLDGATCSMAHILGIKPNEIIYTSGSSEANNLAIKGICYQYQNRGKHIITTALEHSSIIAPLNYLQKHGFEVDFVSLKDDGTVDLEALKHLMRDDTILVTIATVDSELGIRQPIEEIGNFLTTYPKCYFHTDLTQAIGKTNIDLTNIDLASFSGHKIYGLKGIGALIKKEHIVIEPLIHGGKSTTVYRSGTPALPLIVSLNKALKLSILDMDKKNNHIKKLNDKIRARLKLYPLVHINSTSTSLDHTINLSIIDLKPETFMHALEKFDIFISTKSACSMPNSKSLAVFAVTNDEKRAQSSLRISLSYLTTDDEIDMFLKAFDECYHQLVK